MKKTLSFLLAFVMLFVSACAAASAADAVETGSCGEGVSYTLYSDKSLKISGSGKMSDYKNNGSPFAGKAVEKVVIDSGVTSIGNDAFSECSGISEVSIPASVTSIGEWAFAGCVKLKSIEIPSGVKSIGAHAFDGCAGLVSASMVKGLLTIENHAFDGCAGLKSITVPESVTSVGQSAFAGCVSLAAINVSAGNKRYSGNGKCLIDNDTHTLVLACRTGLASLTVPDGVEKIGSNAFNGCTGLKSVKLPDSLTDIEYYAFYGCTGLKSVTLPKNVVSVGAYAFAGCTGLESVSIPEGTVNIRDHAFDGCDKLKIHCAKDSFAEFYAKDNGFGYVTDTEKTGSETDDAGIQASLRELHDHFGENEYYDRYLIGNAIKSIGKWIVKRFRK